MAEDAGNDGLRSDLRENSTGNCASWRKALFHEVSAMYPFNLLVIAAEQCIPADHGDILRASACRL